MKKVFYSLFGVILCLTLLCGCGCENKKQENDNSKNNGFGPFALKIGRLEDNMLNESLKLSDTTFMVEDSSTRYTSNITNVTTNDIDVGKIEVLIKNSNGDTIVKFGSNISNLHAGETKLIDLSLKEELKDYATIEYNIVNNK